MTTANNHDVCHAGVAKPLKMRANKWTAWLPAFAMLAVFLTGFFPMWLKSGRLAGELSRSQRQAQTQQIQLALANAALDARREDYEAARQNLTFFFKLIGAEVDRGLGSVLTGPVLAKLQPLLDQRDDLMRLLARNDPAAADRLAVAYQLCQMSLYPASGLSETRLKSPWQPPTSNEQRMSNSPGPSG